MPPNSKNENSFREAVENSRKIVFFSGAGISTESGISDYRSQGGLWQQFQPVTLQEFLDDEEKRELYWARKKEMFGQIRNAKPNRTHLAIRHLQDRGKLLGAITQNIDGLHALAGIRNVLEIHGTNREVICLSCKETGPFEPVYERLLAGEKTPRCLACDGLLKPRTISFGQALDLEVLQRCVDLARNCDLMITAGSTLVVEPAASIPQIAKNSRAKLAIINRDATPSDPLADFVFHVSAGEFLERTIGCARL